MNDAIQILLNTIEEVKNDILKYVNEDNHNQQEIADFIEEKFYEILGI